MKEADIMLYDEFLTNIQDLQDALFNKNQSLSKALYPLCLSSSGGVKTKN